MADRREVIVTIKQSSILNPNDTIDKIVNNNTKDTVESSATDTSPTIDTGATVNVSIIANQVFQQLKTQVVTEAKYQINKYYTTHDDYVGQRNMNIAMGLVDTAVSFGSSVLSGAIMGSSLGPVGTAVGAVLGGMASLTTTGIGVFNNLDAQNLKVEQANAQLSFTRQRSGYSLTSESIGGDR